MVTISDPATHSRSHIIISAIEHPSIATLADEMSRAGWQVDRLGVDLRGVIRVDELADLIRPETRLVAAMLGQNETGVLQPVAELAAICAQRGVPCTPMRPKSSANCRSISAPGRQLR